MNRNKSIIIAVLLSLLLHILIIVFVKFVPIEKKEDSKGSEPVEVSVIPRSSLDNEEVLEEVIPVEPEIETEETTLDHNKTGGKNAGIETGSKEAAPKQEKVPVKEDINIPKAENKEKIAEVDESSSVAANSINLYDNKTLYEMYRREAEKSAKQSERIIVISDAQEQQFNELFPGNEKRVRLLENGYDAKVFYQDKDVRKETVMPELIGKENSNYDKMVLFVGKFADFKGIDALLDAARIYENNADKNNRTIETIIVGSGVLDEKLRKQKEQLNLKHTHFVGRKNHQEICQLQNLAEVSLIPSRNEPFGLVVIEGTACGHPVIATNSGGIPGILNTDKEDLTNKDKSYVTKLGVLIPPLPDRPNALNDEEKDKLDELTTTYSMIDDNDKKQDFIVQKAQELNLDQKTLEAYFDKYMNTVNAMSTYVTDICD